MGKPSFENTPDYINGGSVFPQNGSALGTPFCMIFRNENPFIVVGVITYAVLNFTAEMKQERERRKRGHFFTINKDE